MMFVLSLANSTMFTTYAIYYVTKLGLNPLELVLVGTVLELTVLIFEGITGVVADTYSRRLSVIIGMFILGVAFTLEGSILWITEWSTLIPAFIWLLISQVMFGIGWTFVSGSDSAWMVDEVGEDQAGPIFMRTKQIALIGTLLGIGISVGLSIVAPNLPYIMGGFMHLALGVFLILFMKETKFVKQEHEANTSPLKAMGKTWLMGAKVVQSNPLLLILIVVTLFSGAASEGFDRLKETFLINEIGFPQGIAFSMAVWFGIIAAVSTIIGIFAVGWTEKRIDMSSKRMISRAMFFLTGARIAAIVTLALSPNFTWAIIAVLAIKVIGIIQSPIYNTWLNMNVESKTRATVLSMVSQSDALGQTAGGPLVGWLGNRVSIRASLLAAAALLSPILVVFGNIWRKRS
ncbi:MFS transporter [Paenibacillus albiflavus]|uniref:MFS transporter n=2 Tax=Paenibacillus albiflavus TaxID=2545760 RepID=A0A4R4EJA3_9BACL|nr:MFS transporter [Paenibacillus albiflavus]